MADEDELPAVSTVRTHYILSLSPDDMESIKDGRTLQKVVWYESSQNGDYQEVIIRVMQGPNLDVNKIVGSWFERLKEVFENRPVTYSAPGRRLDVYYADAHDQRNLLVRFRDMRMDFELAVGGPVYVIFHTSKETERLGRPYENAVKTP